MFSAQPLCRRPESSCAGHIIEGWTTSATIAARTCVPTPCLTVMFLTVRERMRSRLLGTVAYRWDLCSCRPLGIRLDERWPTSSHGQVRIPQRPSFPQRPSRPLPKMRRPLGGSMAVESLTMRKKFCLGTLTEFGRHLSRSSTVDFGTSNHGPSSVRSATQMFSVPP